MVRLFLPFAVAALLACGSSSPAGDPDSSSDDRADDTAEGQRQRTGDASAQCPQAVQPGLACTAEGLRCFDPSTASAACGGQITACTCTEGAFACVQVSVDAPTCAAGQLPDGLGCAREGMPTCDIPPAGGTCSCDAGQWSCDLICPEWCPSSPPAAGEPASCPADAEGRRCPYSNDACCTCRDGKLDCATFC